MRDNGTLMEFKPSEMRDDGRLMEFKPSEEGWRVILLLFSRKYWVPSIRETFHGHQHCVADATKVTKQEVEAAKLAKRLYAIVGRPCRKITISFNPLQPNW